MSPFHSGEAITRRGTDPIPQVLIELTCSVGQEVLSGLKYLHVVKRAGITVDKLEEMIGSFGPRPEPYTKRFATEESPSGMLARSGANTVRSRVVDDDGNVYADW